MPSQAPGYISDSFGNFELHFKGRNMPKDLRNGGSYGTRINQAESLEHVAK